jgi:hypothetical protein
MPFGITFSNQEYPQIKCCLEIQRMLKFLFNFFLYNINFAT